MTANRNASIHSRTGLSEIQNFWLFVNLINMVRWYSFIQGLIRDHWTPNCRRSLFWLFVEQCFNIKTFLKMDEQTVRNSTNKLCPQSLNDLNKGDRVSFWWTPGLSNFKVTRKSGREPSNIVVLTENSVKLAWEVKTLNLRAPYFRGFFYLRTYLGIFFLSCSWDNLGSIMHSGRFLQTRTLYCSTNSLEFLAQTRIPK